MAYLEFYAGGDDQILLLNYLFTETDARIFETHSEVDHELREFRSVEHMKSVIPLGYDPYGKGNHLLLALWSPSVMDAIKVERTNLDPKYGGFRERVRGVGLMKLYLGGIYEKTDYGRIDRYLTKSYFGHFAEKEGQSWVEGEIVDWAGLARLSRQIQYRIRTKCAVAYTRQGNPILPHAASFASQGFRLAEKR